MIMPGVMAMKGVALEPTSTKNFRKRPWGNARMAQTTCVGVDNDSNATEARKKKKKKKHQRLLLKRAGGFAARKSGQ